MASSDIVLVNPKLGSTLACKTVTFRWVAETKPGQDRWLFRVGTEPTGVNHYNLVSISSTDMDLRSVEVTNLPNDGNPVYVTIFRRINSVFDPVEERIVFEFPTGVDNWLRDPLRNEFRIILIEAEHSAGVVRFGSRPWISNTNKIYDDWARNFYLESSLDGLAGIGDFTAVNPTEKEDNPEPWLQYFWQGHPVTMALGDATWKREEFLPLAKGTIQQVVPTDQKSVYRFDCYDGLYKFKAPLVSTDTTKNHNVSAAIEWISEQLGRTVSMVNIPTDKQSWSLSYTASASTTADDLLREIATSINARLRVDALGNAELFIPAEADAEILDKDVIADDGVRGVSVQRPYATVTVVEADGTRHSTDTNADTGELSEEMEIKTLLSNAGDAADLLAEYANYYANKHPVYEVTLKGIPDMIKIGSRKTVDHPQLKNTGLVERIYWEPLSGTTKAEIRL